MELAKKCPFLARVPSSFVRKARGPVLVSYAERCPVMSEVLNKQSEIPPKSDGKADQSSCFNLCLLNSELYTIVL